MKEYCVENNKVVDWQKLKAGFIPNEDYQKAHKHLIIVCHDIMIEYNGGFLLVVRDNYPAKDILWPIGGRALRGVPFEESLRFKVKEECGLEIYEEKYLATARTIFATDPFGHDKGTDTLNILYYAKGKGELSLNSLHSNPVIVTPKNYQEKYKNILHPYVKESLKKGMLESKLNYD